MSEVGRVISIRQLLESKETWPPNNCLFVERGNISLESRCLVDPADLYDVDYVPTLAVENDLKYIIMMETYFDIMKNLEYQVRHSSIEERFNALNFYIVNDAFIVVK